MDDPMYGLAFFLAMNNGKLDPDEPPDFSDPNDEYNYGLKIVSVKTFDDAIAYLTSN